MPQISNAIPPPSRPTGNHRAASPSKATGVPKTLEVVRHQPSQSDNSNHLGDDYSVVSAITMDVHLFHSRANREYAVEDENEVSNHNDQFPIHNALRPGQETSNRKLAMNGTKHDEFENSFRSRNIYPNDNQSPQRYPQPLGLPSTSEINPSQTNEEGSNEIMGFENEKLSPPTIKLTPAIHGNNGLRFDSNSDNEEYQKDERYGKSREIVEIVPETSAREVLEDDFPSYIMDDCDHYPCKDDQTQNSLRQQQMHHFQTLLQHDSYASPQAPPSPPHPIHAKPVEFAEEDIVDVDGILECLNVEECNPDIRERALLKLFEILRNRNRKDNEYDIRDFILGHNIIEAATKSMWAEMQIVEVQEAAMKLLVFIAAATTIIGGRKSKTGSCRHHSTVNLLSKSESVCDSVLFTMQNHATEAGIQLNGCLIFASLAAGSSKTNEVNSDGSLSGAMTMVLNAMSNHGASRSIRKAGLQALHHQCLLSTHAESNMRNLTEGKLGNGMPAIDVVIYAMEELQEDPIAMEWACQLCWSLTSNKSLLEKLEDSTLHGGIVSICRYYMTNPLGIGLVEASIGAIANLASGERKRKELLDSGAFQIVIQSSRHHQNHYGVNFEAALAIENLVIPSDTTTLPLNVSALQLLVRGLKTFADEEEYVIRSFRALSSMANQSQEAKQMIGTEEVFRLIHEVVGTYHTNKILEVSSTLISTLAMGDSPKVSELMVKHGVVELILKAMEVSRDEKVQIASCLALRNLSCQIQCSDPMLMTGKTTRLIIDAMESHPKSVSIQTSACCTFWNLLSKSKKNDLAFHSNTVSSITKAMQSHIECGELLELACGALWVIVDSFEEQKLYVGKEAIDVVTCAMVMQPFTTSTLENCCGLLSHLSSEKSLAEAIANAQGVSIVAEAMCNNGNSIPLLEAGCLTLKNIILACPSFTQDATVAVSTLVQAMKEFDQKTFVKEACDLVWVLASEDENIRSKVLALDGISILMKCLEEHSNDPEIENSALGAFNQLAKPTTVP